MEVIEPFQNKETKKATEFRKKSDQRKMLDLKTRIIAPEEDESEPILETAVEMLNLDQIKAAYIADSLTPTQIADKFNIPVATVRAVIKEGRLIELRRIHVRDGLHRLQNKQIKHAQDLLELENNFKHMKIQQLKLTMEDHMAYLSYHGDFYRRGADGEIVKNKDGIPVTIPLPSADKTIKQLKDSLVMGEGLKQILAKIQLVLEGDEVSGEDLDLEDMFIEAEVESDDGK